MKKHEKKALKAPKTVENMHKAEFEPQTSHYKKAASDAAFLLSAEKIGTGIGTNSFTDLDGIIEESEKKKMQKFKLLQEPLVSYRAAQLFTGSSTWYLEYYVWNPNKMHGAPLEKKRKKLIRDLKPFKTIREKKAMANEICHKLNQKLASGWNPYLENTAPKGFCTVEKALLEWLLNYKHHKRGDTVAWAENKVKFFLNWYGREKSQRSFIVSFDKYMASAFIDHVYIERDNGIRTRTNYLDLFTQIFKWLEAKGYVSNNPFNKIERIKQRGRKKKIRTVINKEYPKLINGYFAENHPGYLYVMNYLYLCLIRRTEMTKLKVGDVDLKNQIIYVSGDVAKNGKERWATIPNSFMDKMKQLQLDQYPKDYYLLSSNEFYPGKEPIKPKRISSVWAWMRKKIGLDKTNQFYSLRDTGVIKYLERGVDNKSLKDHADWQDYAMIGVYADHLTAKAIPSIQENGQMF